MRSTNPAVHQVWVSFKSELDPSSLLVALQRSECAGIALPFVSQKSGYTFARQSKPNLFSSAHLGACVNQAGALSLSSGISTEWSTPTCLPELSHYVGGRNIHVNALFQGWWQQDALILFASPRINGTSAKDFAHGHSNACQHSLRLEGLP